MVYIAGLMDELSEKTIAQKIGIPHDEARMRYPLLSNTVEDFEEFSWIIGDYCNYHFTNCVSFGGSLSDSEAAVRAKELVGQEYRSTGGGDRGTAF